MSIDLSAFPSPGTFLKLKEAASALRMSERTLRSLIRQGNGPVVTRLGARTARIESEDLRNWIVSRKNQNDGDA